MNERSHTNAHIYTRIHIAYLKPGCVCVCVRSVMCTRCVWLCNLKNYTGSCSVTHSLYICTCGFLFSLSLSPFSLALSIWLWTCIKKMENSPGKMPLRTFQYETVLRTRATCMRNICISCPQLEQHIRIVYAKHRTSEMLPTAAAAAAAAAAAGCVCVCKPFSKRRERHLCNFFITHPVNPAHKPEL